MIFNPKYSFKPHISHIQHLYSGPVRESIAILAEKHKLAHLNATFPTTIPTKDENVEMIVPGYVTLDSSTQTPFFLGQSISLDLKNATEYEKMFNQDPGLCLAKDLYALEPIQATEDLDLSAAGLDVAAIDISKPFFGFSYNKDDKNVNGMAFVIMVGKYNRITHQLPNHKFSQKIPGSDLTLNGFVANFNTKQHAGQLREAGYSTQEFEPGLTDTFKVPGDYKGLVEQLLK